MCLLGLWLLHLVAKRHHHWQGLGRSIIGESLLGKRLGMVLRDHIHNWLWIIGHRIEVRLIWLDLWRNIQRVLVLLLITIKFSLKVNLISD